MSETLPVVYLARHGETAWSLSGQHTGLTDLPLTDRGERNARRLGERSERTEFQRRCSRVRCSARAGLVSWLALAPKPKSIATCSNGTTANTRAVAQRKSMQSARTGNCFATVVLEASHRSRLEHALTSGAASARDSGQRFDFLERTHSAGTDRALAGAGTCRLASTSC